MKMFYLMGVLLLCLGSLPVKAQTEKTQPDDVIRQHIDVVTFDAFVHTHKTGLPVADLKATDFKLYEDGVEKEIEYFSQDKLPLSVLFLLDVSGSVLPIYKELRDEALRAVGRFKPEDEIALMVFSTEAQLVQGFTKDRTQFADALGSLGQSVKVGGGTFLNEGMYHATRYLRNAATPNNRKVVIVITDNLASKPLKKGTTHNEKEAMAELIESGGVVCGIIVKSWISNVVTYHPVAALMRTLTQPGSVNHYAEESGGTVIPSRTEQFETTLGKLVDNLRARYSFGYSCSPEAQDGKLHKIKLKPRPEVEKREGKIAIKTIRGFKFSKTGERIKTK